MEELFPEPIKHIDPLKKTERRDVEVYLCWEHLRTVQRHDSSFCFEVLTDAYFLKSESQYLYQVLGRVNKDLIERFREEDASMVY
ncbi:MAG: hypothetical protein RLN85_18520, partial [Pseudomonadales bacterium]